jgi:hypothetical protein
MDRYDCDDLGHKLSGVGSAAGRLAVLAGLVRKANPLAVLNRAVVTGSCVGKPTDERQG